MIQTFLILKDNELHIEPLVDKPMHIQANIPLKIQGGVETVAYATTIWGTLKLKWLKDLIIVAEIGNSTFFDAWIMNQGYMRNDMEETEELPE